ncbi:type I-E CRISPR-associated protein Cas6/Cse3/CasE [Nocardiopsis sp. CNT-189]|uniref:type I-E CRISPR-associated protein Cas6/Cse3/CasE n=1 Tax=Nocardiopsis oceanisediminis TaxID=2816862 RepID=UPI003B389916
MYLTRTFINPRRRGAVPFIGNPQKLHAAVMQAFPQSPASDAAEGARVLWRLDGDDPRRPVLWTVSPDRPSMRHVTEPYGWPESDRAFETREYGPLLDRLGEGQRYIFRVTVNPVKALPPAEPEQGSPDGKRPRGGRVPLVGVEAQVEWFAERSEKWGFRLLPGRVGRPDADADGRPARAVEVRDSRKLRFWREKKAKPVVLNTVTFEGLMEVADAEALRTSLTRGVGRAKGYGCGLISLAPAPGGR